MNLPYTVADYLLDRLAEIGIEHIFGVPGDYNLLFLDHIIDHPMITWVGCANELNAAYAADGYARSKPAAALLTTFGVGELSAVNGIAGSYAEYLPVIHIVGAPKLSAQHSGAILHHSLGDGEFGHFMRIAKEVTCAQASLTIINAEAEIDRLLTIALFEQRPVYLSLPSDVAISPIISRPQPLIKQQALCSPASLNAFIEAAKALLSQAKRVSLLADFVAQRFAMQDLLQQWMNEVNIPHATLMMGKGLFNEDHPYFTGTYAGIGSEPQVNACIEEADVVILVGVHFNDIITAGFSQHFSPISTIDIQPFSARVGERYFSQLPMKEAITALRQLTDAFAPHWQHTPIIKPATAPSTHAPLTQQNFWPLLQRYLLPGDRVIVDMGTASFGAATITLPPQCHFIMQALWASIGYTLPAAFGALTADPTRRVILVIGDGAAQLTIQELGSILRDGYTPLIFLLNNDGYSVERAIHGPLQRYNDISPWNWQYITKAFSHNVSVNGQQVNDTAVLDSILSTTRYVDQLLFIEVILPKMDFPPLLNTITSSIK